MLRSQYQGDMPTNTLSFLDNITRSTDRMKALIHDILAYSTIESHDTNYDVVDLNQLAAEVQADLEMAIRDKEAVVQVGVLPQIKGHPAQLKQLFANLLTNSLKYSKNDVRPEIDVTAEETENDVILNFKDNGIGFDVMYLDKMFHLFQRLHSRDKYSGTGIGLAICKKIVAMHGGTITADSELGTGSVFVVSLPKQIQNWNG